MHFKDLPIDNRLIKPLVHMGLGEATKIQELAIPVAVAGKDLLASSKTGSGKTFAFLLPMLHHLIRKKSLHRRDPRALILAPTRELAKQVYGQLKHLSSSLRFESTLIVGGENFNDQAKAFRRDPDIIVATPGRIVDHLKHDHTYFDNLELLILDEADRMLDLGFATEIDFINKAASHRLRQTLMFSATLDNASVNALEKDLLKQPKRIAVGESNSTNQDVTQKFYLCDHLDHKEAIMQRLIDDANYNQMIIFTATRADTIRLADKLNELDLKAVALSGDLSQSERNKIMSQFERKVFLILVTTDVASRGLDILNVSHVINFDMPKLATEYIHRVGRTGRAGNTGEAYSLVGPNDWNSFTRVKTLLDKKIKFTTLSDLVGKFKGFKPKFKKKTATNKKRSAPSQSKAPTQKARKRKLDKGFYTNVAVGNDVFIPKKVKKVEPEDLVKPEIKIDLEN